jgi:hypothetical protein
MVHIVALVGAIVIAVGVHSPIARDAYWNALFFSYNWWGTHFMAKWVSKRMKKDSRRALFEIYLKQRGWKLQLNFLNVECILIERNSFSHKQGV